jgi:NTE family protein
MSLPYYFQPFYCPDSGHYLIDGGVISNYPMFLLSKEEQLQTIGILIPACVNTVEDIDSLPIDEAVIRPMNIAFQEKIKIETELYHSGCIQIHLADINIIDFSFEDETKDRIIAKGREAVRTFLASQPRPHRRNSI